MSASRGSPDGGRPGLRTALSTPENKARYVRRLFSTIAGKYDLITVLLSYGQDRRWKRRLTSLAQVRPGMSALDLACGTGDIAAAVSAGGAKATGLDITLPMLEIAAARKLGPAGPGWVCGDMMALPFGGGRFDLVTTGYGIRNVPDIAGAIAEIRRVLKPGGVFLSLDFNRPSSVPVRAVYLAYLTIVGSALGFVLHGDPDTYRYIPESIRRYPGAAAVRDILRDQGFSSCEYLPVLGGLMAIHRAVR